MKIKLSIVHAACFEVWSVISFLGMKGETPHSIHAKIARVYGGDNIAIIHFYFTFIEV